MIVNINVLRRNFEKEPDHKIFIKPKFFMPWQHVLFKRSENRILKQRTFKKHLTNKNVKIII
jgi:hypothetical protein